jgi:hypothetical protein
MKYIVGFGRFWYDFIVGDSIVLAIGGMGVLALGFGLSRLDESASGLADVAQVVLPLAVIGTVWGSLPLWRRR